MTQPDEIHIVPELSAPIRLQEYGVGIFNRCPTKSSLKKTIKKNYITVNQKIASTATYILGGECIELTVPQGEENPKRKLIFPLKVLFEDEFLAVIHKPAGILVSGNSFKTIANALSQNLQKSKLLDATKPQPIHRLDYATTGILLVGKAGGSIRALYQMFEDKAVEKVYYAITIGPMDTNGEITTEIDGKQAHTLFKVRATVPSARFGALNLVELIPRTGRTHQLRRHMLGIGNPILGDKEYAHEDLVLNGKGLYLHAYSLKFVHPVTQIEMHQTDDLPERFTKIFPIFSNS
jgi:23S rRNA pseudouridine1911/1915/1917 synthase